MNGVPGGAVSLKHLGNPEIPATANEEYDPLHNFYSELNDEIILSSL